MTLEQLLNAPSVEELRKLDFKEVEALLLPYLPKSRPELVREEKRKASVKVLSGVEIEHKRKVEAAKKVLAEQFGLKF